MSDWNKGGYRLTAAGRRLQAKVEAGIVLALTKMKVGSGLETADEIDDLVDLVAPQAEFGIISADVSGETCAITGNLLVNNVRTGFWCREWGVFAQDPDDGEILYAIALDAEPDWIPAGAEIGTSITYTMNIAVANATEVSVNVDVAGLVDVTSLVRYTHSCTRQATYKDGEVLNHPGLQNGLVLECQSGGITADTLPDFSKLNCGDEFVDGSVNWQVKKPILAPSGAFYYKAEWNYEAIGRLVTFCQNVRDTAALITTDDGDEFHLGGNGGGVDIDDILLPEDTYAGTVFLYLSKSNPTAGGFAWIENADIDGEIINAVPRVLLDSGDVITTTKGKIVRSDDVIYYVDTVSREPVSTSAAYDYTLATDDDIDAIFPT